MEKNWALSVDQVIAARNDILNEVKYLQSVVREINEFHHVENEEEDF